MIFVKLISIRTAQYAVPVLMRDFSSFSAIIHVKVSSSIDADFDNIFDNISGYACDSRTFIARSRLRERWRCR